MKNNTYCVIMAGGIGSRFWPLSRKNLPKQFLDFFGVGRTLLQQTYDRYVKLVDKERIYVVTNVDYIELVKNQLPDINPKQILAEPTRRNTAPCLAWATYHIHSKYPEACIVFTPADHLIIKEEQFLTDLEGGCDYVEQTDRLLCIGIRPTRPETRYGYIQVSESGKGEFWPVKTFTEKPEQDLAEVFVNSGEFYWNAGIFLGKAKIILDAFQRYAPELAANFESNEKDIIYGTCNEISFIEKNFPSCPNVSIEYGILEKVENVYVMTCDFGWSDLGTWSTYHEALPKDEDGNALQNSLTWQYECQGCLIGSQNKEKLVIVHGLENYLVADTDDVLLICPKDDPNILRKVANDAQAQIGDSKA